MAGAKALIAQRKSDLDFTRTDYERAKYLVGQGHISQQVSDQRRNKFEATEAAYVAAEAQRDQADAQIKAAEADVERLQSILVDLVLVSPRSGRVQYRLARVGEVVAAGQRVLTILDLNDVYMTIYLPAERFKKVQITRRSRPRDAETRSLCAIIDKFDVRVVSEYEPEFWDTRQRKSGKLSGKPFQRRMSVNSMIRL